MTAAPIRVRLSRAKGSRMPPNTVKVDRSTKWGNPFSVGDTAISWRSTVVDMYRVWLRGREDLVRSAQTELCGKNLACWCPLPEPGHPDYCHAAVLLEIANGDRS